MSTPCRPPYSPPVRSLSLLWLSKVKVPGQELGRNELWQVDELELIEQEDYDRILEMGYAA
ncbi:MAG TPA: hypothetical protein DCP91_03790 [Eggerthellaceae bacterium]|nr:hypothetical protein [Eggerthellaceae bacterium]